MKNDNFREWMELYLMFKKPPMLKRVVFYTFLVILSPFILVVSFLIWPMYVGWWLSDEYEEIAVLMGGAMSCLWIIAIVLFSFIIPLFN